MKMVAETCFRRQFGGLTRDKTPVNYSFAAVIGATELLVLGWHSKEIQPAYDLI